MLLETFKDRRVFITGHTGFKGSWLSQWLTSLGAEVCGYALAPPTSPSLFNQLNLASQVDSRVGDVRDLAQLSKELCDWKPDFVFHLAAQPVVRASYDNPIETLTTNAMGSIHMLQSLRQLDQPCVAVMITSDKCYKNQEWLFGYREDDTLGGQDPYSCSKAMAELAIDSYRHSYFANSPIRVCSARAGNVIGGGDWAADRILPDCIRALQAGDAIKIRNPGARRPWQHVLEPLSGYLRLAAKLDSLDQDKSQAYCSAFNFGPECDANRTVAEVVQQVLVHWPGEWIDARQASAPYEANLLALASNKASQLLDWRCRWSISETIQHAVQWYHQVHLGQSALSVTKQQISAYQELAF